jgi:hypothetical protein
MILPRLSDREIAEQYSKISGLSNPSERLQLIQIELQFRIIEELRILYGATH